MNTKNALEILATNVRKYRAINRMSQEKLAELSDLTQ